MTAFDDIGGEHGLRAIINEFVDRCFDDPMIGFFFRDAKRERIKKFEFQHAAVWLGAKIAYEGRAIAAAHERHPIMGGQFARRLQILREVLNKHMVPAELGEAWIAHQEKFRSEVTRDRDGECID